MTATYQVPTKLSTQFIPTKLGEIAVQIKEVPNTTPIIFLHGVYFDHHLWNYQTSKITDRTVITIDMPLHGDSKRNVPDHWNLEDCGDMLIDILDTLHLPKVIAIGHSWGSMTLLRAAYQHPDRFQSIGFCNMPFEEPTKKAKFNFRLQHRMLPFRNFYTKQVAKALYGRQELKQTPALLEYLQLPMSKLSNKEVRITDKHVILKAENTLEKIQSLNIPAIALKGREDYVPVAENIDYTIVEGGHVSPLEAPEEVLLFIRRVIDR